MKENYKLGYCCINVQLAEKDISCNRGMVKKTFEKKGHDYVSEIAIANIKDLIKILHWNADHDIQLYRVTSNLFPWMSEYEISELPRFDEISNLLLEAGSFAKLTGQRLTFHPGPFNVLGSPDANAVNKTIKDLNNHSEIFDLMGLEASHYYPINIHVGGTYDSKPDTLARFCDNFKRLSATAQKRLVVENDDRPSMYCVQELYQGIYSNVRVPITFDYHHHRFNSGNLTEEEALRVAESTWKCQQLVHYSSCKKTFEDPKSKALAHADWIYEKIKTYGLHLDIELEAKSKELAIFDYNRRKNDKSLLNEYVEL
jgi:UV DNA damage endonuclease